MRKMLIAACVSTVLLIAVVTPRATVADESGLSSALQESRLVSSYFQFARRCQIDGAISHGELTAFRQRLLDALFEKYALDSDEEQQVIRVLEDDSVVIATAGLSLSPEVCARFLGSI